MNQFKKGHILWNKGNIEVFWKGFKTKPCFHGMDLNIWKKERLDLFKKYGWNIIFFDETEVKENIILDKIKKYRGD